MKLAKEYSYSVKLRSAGLSVVVSDSSVGRCLPVCKTVSGSNDGKALQSGGLFGEKIRN